MSSIDKYLWPTRLLCTTVGMWPLSADDSSFEKRFSLFRKFFSLVAVGNILIPEILAIVKSQWDIVVIARVGCVLITVVLHMCKTLYLILNGTELDRLYCAVRQLWDITESLQERKVCETFAQRGKLFTIIFFFFAFGNTVSFTITAVIDWTKEVNSKERSELQRHLPFEVHYGSNIQATPNYEITFACQVLSSLFCCIGIVGLDTLMMTLVLHICGQFALLKLWYREIKEKMIKNQYINKETRDSFNYLSSEVERCFQHHQKIIIIADKLEAIFNPLIFMQFVTSASEICLSVYAITTWENSKAEQVRFTNYLISMIVQLYGWCMIGQNLMEESESIGDSVFHDVPWYQFPAPYQCNFQLVIQRSQKCCRLTAAKFQTMNVEKLGQVLSSAVSYFMLLRQIR